MQGQQLDSCAWHENRMVNSHPYDLGKNFASSEVGEIRNPD